MACEISWTDTALKDYDNIITYLLGNWPVSTAQNFQNIVNKKLENLSQRPYTGISSDINPVVRSILLTPHNRLYYKIVKETIEIINIFDTRSDPKKNPFKK